jgi:hypothetical protein
MLLPHKPCLSIDKFAVHFMVIDQFCSVLLCVHMRGNMAHRAELSRTGQLP